MKRAVLFFLIVFLNLITGGCRSDLEDNKENQEIGQSIISAVDTYYEKNNEEYPSSLDVLVPNFLTSLPETVRGEAFEYFRDIHEGYYLCFGPVTNDKYGCCYNKRLDSWDCTDGD